MILKLFQWAEENGSEAETVTELLEVSYHLYYNTILDYFKLKDAPSDFSILG